MKTKIENIKLSHGTSHEVKTIIFFYETDPNDQKYIDDLLEEADALSKKVNKSAANDGTRRRHEFVIKANTIAGLLAEDLWKQSINEICDEDIVYRPEPEDLGNQIDIASIDDEFTMEVRSSFPRNGIQFAVSNERHGFKIVGPYTNGYKDHENDRDFYLTALFPLNRPGDIVEGIKKDNFSFSLTGGATLEMMKGSDAVSFTSNLSPEDSPTTTQTEYQVINIRDGLDYSQILEEIQDTVCE